MYGCRKPAKEPLRPKKYPTLRKKASECFMILYMVNASN